MAMERPSRRKLYSEEKREAYPLEQTKTISWCRCCAGCAGAGSCTVFVGGSWLEKRSQKPETRTELPQETAETMEVDGVTYRRRTDLTTILVMGIDHDSEVEAEGSYQGGQADFQRLIVIDSKDKTVRQLKIDRDTMAEVTVLGMLGNPVGTTQMQISLAHGFGDGKEESCGYARDAVSRLLQGETLISIWL